MTEKLIKELISFARDSIIAEIRTTAGLINLLGMVASLILAVVLSLGPVLEALVRLIRPQVDVGVSVLQVFIAFCVFTIICSAMLGYLERGSPTKGDGEDADGRPRGLRRHTDSDAPWREP